MFFKELLNLFDCSKLKKHLGLKKLKKFGKIRFKSPRNPKTLIDDA